MKETRAEAHLTAEGRETVEKTTRKNAERKLREEKTEKNGSEIKKT